MNIYEERTQERKLRLEGRRVKHQGMRKRTVVILSRCYDMYMTRRVRMMLNLVNE